MPLPCLTHGHLGTVPPPLTAPTPTLSPNSHLDKLTSSESLQETEQGYVPTFVNSSRQTSCDDLYLFYHRVGNGRRMRKVG